MIVRRLLREDWWKVGAYAGVLLVNVIVTVAAFPTFKTQFSAVVNFIPDWAGFLKNALVNAGGGRFTVFVSLNHFFKGANVIGPTAAIILALGSIVREVEVGTIGLLLSRPVSRARILWSFIGVHLAELLVPLVVISAIIPWLARVMLDEHVPLAPMLLAAAHAAAFIAMIYALALLCAVVLSEQLRVVAIAGGICVVSFLLFFIEATQPFTIYSLSSIDDYLAIVNDGKVAWGHVAACVALCALFLGAAHAVFARKDY